MEADNEEDADEGDDELDTDDVDLAEKKQNIKISRAALATASTYARITEGFTTPATKTKEERPARKSPT